MRGFREAHSCCCEGGKPRVKPGQLASSPASLSVMGKGDKRGHAQRPDGELMFHLETSVTIQQPGIRNIKFHTHEVSKYQMTINV